MDDVAFAKNVNLWLDPEALFGAVQRYQTDSETAITPQTLVIVSGRLRSGDEADFSYLVQKYLRAFRVPPEIIDVLRCIPAASIVGDEAWHWLSNLTFTGRVRALSAADGLEPPPHKILCVDERDVVVDILNAPIRALLDAVDRCAITWREAAEHELPAFHVSTTHMPFCNFIDMRVAKTFLPLCPRPHVSGQKGPVNRYRAVTVFGCSDPHDPTWELAASVARKMAESTFDAIRDS